MIRLEGRGPRGPYQRAVFWMARRMFGREPGSLRVYARYPALLRGAVGMERALQGGRLPPRTRALADLVAARTVGCRYCVDVGAWVGAKHGLDLADLRALDGFETSPRFTEAERAVIAYAEAMSATPPAVTDELFARVRAAFDDDTIVELTAVIAWEQFRSRFNTALGVQPDGFTDAERCQLLLKPAGG